MNDTEAFDGNALLVALRDGDRAATERFVRSNTGWMLHVARRIVRDPTLAEDAVQNAFASIFKNLGSFDGRAALKTWMHRIVINEALMLLRKAGRIKEDAIDPLLPTFDQNGCRVEPSWGEIEDPETLVERANIRMMVVDMIDRLPEKYRIVLMLRDIEEVSTADAAALLDVTEGTVKVRLHRARAALKKLLEPVLRGEAE